MKMWRSEGLAAQFLASALDEVSDQLHTPAALATGYKGDHMSQTRRLTYATRSV
jgi:hypothetical protein